MTFQTGVDGIRLEGDTLGLSISVAMCSFNGERFLSAQLESIAAQDRPPDELVVCDDGSSDGSIEIVREFAQSAPFPTRLVVNEKNLGSTKNFEKAISLCQGAIVALADQDDVWYRHKLGRIEKTFLRSGAIVAVFSDADLIDDDSRLLGLRLWNAFSFDTGEQGWFTNGRALNVLVKHPVVTGATMAFRRDLFDIVAPLPANDIHDRWISFLLAARGQVEIIAHPLMQYRRHEGQQEGLSPLLPRELITQARSRGADFHLGEIARFRQLYDTLGKRRAYFPYAEYAQKEIERKISHLTNRARLPRSRVARIPRVLREAFNRGYWRYSAGWNSIAKDLVIR
ncbi:MAG: glycosyltransferase family 2 protein [Terriglobales bacterium]|jgi:glycosyltransferase involved in cell wall biosynthesis